MHFLKLYLVYMYMLIWTILPWQYTELEAPKQSTCNSFNSQNYYEQYRLPLYGTIIKSVYAYGNILETGGYSCSCKKPSNVLVWYMYNRNLVV